MEATPSTWHRPPSLILRSRWEKARLNQVCKNREKLEKAAKQARRGSAKNHQNPPRKTMKNNGKNRSEADSHGASAAAAMALSGKRNLAHGLNQEPIFSMRLTRSAFCFTSSL